MIPQSIFFLLVIILQTLQAGSSLWCGNYNTAIMMAGLAIANLMIYLKGI